MASVFVNCTLEWIKSMHNEYDEYPANSKVSLAARLTTPFRLLYLFLQGIPVIGTLLRPMLSLLISLTLSYILTDACIRTEMLSLEGRSTVMV
ncbi:MAG: hypothetical protein P1V97_16140, partial [Planctomycetota bacterium]|nr:hypothetical protein [Planctomycetota bacterium]